MQIMDNVLCIYSLCVLCNTHITYIRKHRVIWKGGVCLCSLNIKVTKDYFMYICIVCTYLIPFCRETPAWNNFLDLFIIYLWVFCVSIFFICFFTFSFIFIYYAFTMKHNYENCNCICHYISKVDMSYLFNRIWTYMINN